MTFGNRLKQIRADAGLTQQQLADQSGVHRVDIAHYERGKRFPSLELASKICQALGVSLAVFDDVTFEGQPR